MSLLTLCQVLPSQEEVVRRTEAITRCIQELLISAKDEKVRRDGQLIVRRKGTDN